MLLFGGNIDIENEQFLKERKVGLKCIKKIDDICIWEWDYKLNEIYILGGFYEVFDINNKKFLGSFEHIIQSYVQSEYRNIVLEEVEKARKVGKINKLEFKIVTSSKEEKWIRINGDFIYDDNKNKIKMIGVIQDITQWKKSEILLQENYKFLEMLIDTIPSPIFYKDENGIYKYSNVAHTEYLGLKKEEIIGHNIYNVMPKEIVRYHSKIDNELIENKGKKTYESKFKCSDGILHNVIFNKATYTNHKGKVKGIVGVMVDITERKNTEKRINRLLKIKEAMLEISYSITEINNINELFNLILDKITQAMKNAELACILTLDKYENLRVAACKGYDKEKAKEYNLNLRDTFIWNETKGTIEKAVIINDIHKILEKKFPNVLENKGKLNVQSSISSPIIIGGKLYGFINVDSRNNYAFDEIDLEVMEYIRNQIAISISKHKFYEETIYLSRYDRLTDIYNRNYFEELIYTNIQKANKYKEEFCLVVFDLNGLKYVNDNYGHLAGDKFIKTFASTLSSNIHSYDIIARLGGDEFVGVFLRTDVQSLKNKFEDLLMYFNNNKIIFEGNSITCSFSYGIASFPDDSISYNELVKIADKRMYKYKQEFKKTFGMKIYELD
ncbi:diguanylate cyclase [Tepidibacter hydrothermalis]|uniref:Diguanylate cyclase n=1 Tax=Tepidibacter hydrothermalis TaxID=3036126 RepID=A0ABY8ELF9_9FIRM|nr:diguanylate cyclase [Tepidibacter hydrothermalis]WFD12163.1 diguanylate cyclase [Tepidibacter hydrothermalis]